MDISVFDLFKIGIGPSSSHTVGPMRAARKAIEDMPDLDRVARVSVLLYGSLALTGRGHRTDIAIILGLSGLRQDTVEPDSSGTQRCTESARRPTMMHPIPALG